MRGISTTRVTVLLELSLRRVVVRFADVDASAVEGIAMTWADSSNGTWQYSAGRQGSVWNRRRLR